MERVELELSAPEPAPGIGDAVGRGLAPAAPEPVAAAQEPEPPTQEPPAADPAPEDPAAAAFRRTEEIRRKALEGLKTPRPAPGKKTGGGKDKLIYGRRPVSKDPTPMGDLELDMGAVVVEGDVFAVDHRELKKRGAWVVSFDLTDYTGSVRVNKFFPGDEGKPIVEGVKKGQHLRIQGKLNIDRFTGDMVLEPYAIMEGTRAARTDDAPVKRVELHLHTNMSAMDALTAVGSKMDSPVGVDKNVIKRAERWGHRAIAITDHGVAPRIPQRLALGQEHQDPLRCGGLFHQRRGRPGGHPRHGGAGLRRRDRLLRHRDHRPGQPPGPDHRDRRGGAEKRGDHRKILHLRRP